MESSIQIEETAAQWLARRDSDEWSERDEATFNDWLEQSTLHVVAFVRLEAAWAEAKRLKALSAGVEPGTVPSTHDWQLDPFLDTPKSAPVLPRSMSRAYRHISIAAGVLLVLAATIGYYAYRSFDSTYRTAVGGMASVPMSDGSTVTLNTDSRIRLALSDTERRVELEKGEAFFDVAKDPKRPFVVEAGGKRIIAVGTRFSVRRDDDDVRVVVTEGKVEVTGARGTSTGIEKPQDAAVLLGAGTIASASEGGVLIQEKSVPEAEGFLSWRTGHLTFRDTALGDAVAEFNRYNVPQIVIEDPAVAAIRVSGKFRSTQFEAFVRLVERGFPVRAQRQGDRILLTDRASAAGTAAHE